ncbi:HupE/UreJ family protein [Flavobacterium silvaticum]|uniref:HupE/UreJ family protein n=1 Tax=Flavobacterium silvaticum TaxID=1852020 RepID=A0A972FSP9_9FLAO|nr:HupE/UreJ family protein [Flavobacterium silvaticum]NMH27773.1 HupE/UreJ family protein [Flavobacterium silvaticum]
MSDFLVFVETGLRHVLDVRGYDHILFLIALTLPYSLADWKKLLVQVSIFTLGHSVSLMLAGFGLISAPISFVEFLIPVTIIATAIYRIAKPSDAANSLTSWITLGFGFIHGLGFSNYFNAILMGSPSDKVVPLVSFALGIELAQLVIVAVLLTLEFASRKGFKCNRRDFNIVAASMVIGIALPILADTASELIKN